MAHALTGIKENMEKRPAVKTDFVLGARFLIPMARGAKGLVEARYCPDSWVFEGKALLKVRGKNRRSGFTSQRRVRIEDCDLIMSGVGVQ